MSDARDSIPLTDASRRYSAFGQTASDVGKRQNQNSLQPSSLPFGNGAILLYELILHPRCKTHRRAALSRKATFITVRATVRAFLASTTGRCQLVLRSMQQECCRQLQPDNIISDKYLSSGFSLDEPPTSLEDAIRCLVSIDETSAPCECAFARLVCRSINNILCACEFLSFLLSLWHLE